MKADGIQPALVLCSSARRARETLEGLGLEGQISIEPELYAANVDQLLARLWQIPDETGSAMVVGHNPALQILVLRLAASSPDPTGNGDLAAVRHKYPTGALATLSFDCAWGQLAARTAEIVGSPLSDRDLVVRHPAKQLQRAALGQRLVQVAAFG